MSGPPVIRFAAVSKRFGDVAAVDDVSFEVSPGRIVGLLGRNGAGKTTCLRMLLGLSRPTSGAATVFGVPYGDLPGAARRIGVSMDGIGPLPGVRVARDLRVWADALGLGRRRVATVLDQVGLADAAGRRVKDLSTGMKQRHALAVALLADPEVLILDEPANGLDPDGIRWLRGLLRELADRGRTVLMSSHLLSEIEQTVDDVVIIQRTLRYVGPLRDLTAGGGSRLEDRFFDLVGPRVPVSAGGGTDA
ncbi:ABC transporter ATP-binding protein [Nakamurella sp.]|uniref:ABC transporter ATP-binding protein n=1 Tax=Nakamurella sp. TaxID=1869182 RepID=UPI003B3B2DCB